MLKKVDWCFNDFFLREAVGRGKNRKDFMDIYFLTLAFSNTWSFLCHWLLSSHKAIFSFANDFHIYSINKVSKAHLQKAIYICSNNFWINFERSISLIQLLDTPSNCKLKCEAYTTRTEMANTWHDRLEFQLGSCILLVSSMYCNTSISETRTTTNLGECNISPLFSNFHNCLLILVHLFAQLFRIISGGRDPQDRWVQP